MLQHVHIPERWNEEILRLGGSFLQSWEWSVFQEKAGAKVMRLRDAQGSPSLWLARALPLKKMYWYSPRGPLGEFSASDEVFKGATFVRVEPTHVPKGATKTTSVQPSQTLILDLSKSQEELMKEMHQKTRYNIGLAGRKGVRVYHASGADKNAFEIFWALVEETTGRDRFRAHDKEYYRTMLETLAGDPQRDGKKRAVAQLVFAEHDGRVLAASVMIYFGDTLTYLHGASSNTRREVMAPYALHWELIKEASLWGYADYDFWGVAPEGAEKHPLAGVSRFKRGWGGTYVQYPGTFDVALDTFWYGLYMMLKKLRGH